MYRRVFAFAISGSVCAWPALAQDETIFLNTIVIFTSDAAGIQIDDEDLERIDPTDLQDLFASEPTIQVGSSLPISQKLYVNGIEETSLAVTVDGSRQNNKIFHHSTTNLIDPALLKAVTVDPGVAPADAGPGALAGAIQFETKDAKDLLVPGRNVGGFLKTEYETNGDIFTNSASVYGAFRGFEALGFLKYADGGSREDGNGDSIIGSGTAILSGLAKVAYEAPTGDRFELSYEGVNDDEARPYRANIGRIVGGRPVPATRGYDMLRQNFVFTYTDEMPEGWWDPTVKLAYSVTDLALTEPDIVVEGTTDSLNGKFENRFALSNGSITAGADFYADKADTYYSEPGYVEEGQEEVFNIGLYSQARLNLTDRWRISFGGRGDYQEFEGADGTTIEDAGLSGNVSSDFDLTNILTVSAGYSHVWAGFPLAENFILNPAWTYPDGLKPVTGDSIFAGARADFEGALSGFWIDGKVFRTDIDNARKPVYSGDPAFTRQVESHGFEVGFGYNWGTGFVHVGFADITSRIDGKPADSDTGQYLTTPVGSIFTVEAAHTFAGYGLTIGANAEIALEEKDTYDVDTGGRGEPLPGYQVVDAFLQYQPPRFPNVTLRAEVNNLFDETYASRATYGQEYGTVIPLYEPGRSFGVSGKVTF